MVCMLPSRHFYSSPSIYPSICQVLVQFTKYLKFTRKYKPSLSKRKRSKKFDIFESKIDQTCPCTTITILVLSHIDPPVMKINKQDRRVMHWEDIIFPNLGMLSYAQHGCHQKIIRKINFGSLLENSKKILKTLDIEGA